MEEKTHLRGGAILTELLKKRVLNMFLLWQVGFVINFRRIHGMSNASYKLPS